MDTITTGDASSHRLTTQDLEALVNIQAELERLHSLDGNLEPASAEELHCGHEEMLVEEIVVHQQEDQDLQEHEEVVVKLQQQEDEQSSLASNIVGPISTSFLTTSSMNVLNVVNADGLSYEIIERIGDHDQPSEEALTHFLDDDTTIVSASEVTIGGDSSDIGHDERTGGRIDGGHVDDETLQFGIPEVPSAMSMGETRDSSYEESGDDHCNPVTSSSSDVVATVETFAALTDSSSAFTFLSSAVPSMAEPVMSTGHPTTFTVKTEKPDQVTIMVSSSSAQPATASPMTFTAVKTVTVAPSSILDRLTTTAATLTTTTSTAINAPKVSRPIYLIPNSSGSLTMTTVAPTTVVTAKSTNDPALLNKVVFTATNPLAAAGLKVQHPAPSRTLTALQSRVVPTVVRAGGLLSSAQTSAQTTAIVSNNQLITKMIFANNSASGGQATGMTTLSSGQANAILSGLPQQVKIVTAAQAQALVGQNKAISLGQTSLTSPIKQQPQQQQQVITSIPGSPSKQAFMLGKYALSPKTPTTITMIPVTAPMKSPVKIALAGTSIAPRVGSILSTLTTSTAVSSSPTPKFIIKPVSSTVGVKAGSLLTPVSTTSSINAVPSAPTITIPTSMMTTLNSSGATSQGNKFSYIRLVQTSAASAATSSTVGRTQHQLIGPIVSAASRPIAAVTTTTSAASRLQQQPLSSGNQSIAPQVKIAVPIAPAAGHTFKTVGGQQRILIPASAMGNLAQLRPTTGLPSSAGTITLPANALAHLPPGTTFFSPGSNIMMVPAQYVTQFQQQQQHQPPGQRQQTTVMVSTAGSATAVQQATSFSSTPAVSLVSQATPPIFSSQPVAISMAQMAAGGGVLKHHQVTTSAATPSLPASLVSFLNERSHSKHQVNGRATQDSNGVRPRKPCNCTKSQCLKLYCDCFANGEFCHDCNCNNCFNNLEHEEERQKAIKSCLERNPQAFHPKIDISFATKAKDGDIERRHNKGCNCKRSGCLKNYCECYEAKIMCSYMCKCVGCKNVEETADKKTLMHLADAAEVRVQQQTAARNKLSSQMMDAVSAAAVCGQNLGPTSGDKVFSSFITTDVVETTCQCLLAQADEGRRQNQSDVVVEQLVVQEFGRCLQQIIEYASKTKPRK